MSYFPRNKGFYVAFLIIMGIIEIASGRSLHRLQYIPKLPMLASIPTIVVDHSGHGNFSTIQSAINSVPSNNSNWICIYIKAGTYNEQVKIPAEKPMIYLKGEGGKITNVVWSNADITNPTFLVNADNIVARDLSFTNSYNYPRENNQNPVKPATAATINGDKNAFYYCGFYGFQDTLWDAQGRHYFKRCYIRGAIDFIFGDGQSIYENCNMNVISKTLPHGGSGYITANGRDNPNEGSGFVFKYCTVDGDGPAYLGRAWREYARVLYYSCNLSSIVVPLGWDAWNYAGHEYDLTFAENSCTGPGSDNSRRKRVKWAANLTQNMLKTLTSTSFVDREGWIKQQPISMQ